ncbi:hypothetical protein OIO90_002387 [Microbotryomycetes sp. JL221]|nr:hypothetical protein OIO90_002387 [Microbotryomycetes sp. JL221]
MGAPDVERFLDGMFGPATAGDHGHHHHHQEGDDDDHAEQRQTSNARTTRTNATARSANTSSRPTTASARAANRTSSRRDSDEDWSTEDSDVEQEQSRDDYDFLQGHGPFPTSPHPVREVKKTYPDVMPGNLMLPLAFISRTFLAATRTQLYKAVILDTPWQAHLLLQSLTAKTHAAHRNEQGPANILPYLIKNLFLTVDGEISLGRGGGQTYLDVLSACPNIESLKMDRLRFQRSATEPLLRTLEKLRNLREIEITSGGSPSANIITSFNLVKLFTKYWTELVSLTIFNLEPAAGSGTRAEHWDFLQDFRQNVPRPKSKLQKVRLDMPAISDSEYEILVIGMGPNVKQFELINPLGNIRNGLTTSLLVHLQNITNLVIEVAKGDLTTTESDLQESLDDYAPISAVCQYKGFGCHLPRSELPDVLEKPYFLNSVVPYLSQLKRCEWHGPIASSLIFGLFPETVAVVSWSKCPAVKPAKVASLLNETWYEDQVIKEANGSLIHKTTARQYSAGLTCMTVSGDDLTWSVQDKDRIQTSAENRDCCMHFSCLSMGMDAAAGTFMDDFPAFLGGLGAGLGAMPLAPGGRDQASRDAPATATRNNLNGTRGGNNASGTANRNDGVDATRPSASTRGNTGNSRSQSNAGNARGQANAGNARTADTAGTNDGGSDLVTERNSQVRSQITNAAGTFGVNTSNVARAGSAAGSTTVSDGVARVNGIVGGSVPASATNNAARGPLPADGSNVPRGQSTFNRSNATASPRWTAFEPLEDFVHNVNTRRGDRPLDTATDQPVTAEPSRSRSTRTRRQDSTFAAGHNRVRSRLPGRATLPSMPNFDFTTPLSPSNGRQL